MKSLIITIAARRFRLIQLALRPVAVEHCGYLFFSLPLDGADGMDAVAPEAISMIKKPKLLIIITALIVLTVITLSHEINTVVKPKYSLYLFQSKEGWGYNININNKPYIHQVYMPAIDGNYMFPDKYSAKKTGLLVIQKLKNNKPPFITKKELDSCLLRQ